MYHRDHRYGTPRGGASGGKKANNTNNVNKSARASARGGPSIVPTPFNLPSIRNSSKSRPGASAIRSAGSSWGSGALGAGAGSARNGVGGVNGNSGMGNGKSGENGAQKPVWGGNGVRAVTGKEVADGINRGLEDTSKSQESTNSNVNTEGMGFSVKDNRQPSNDARVLNGTLSSEQQDAIVPKSSNLETASDGKKKDTEKQDVLASGNQVGGDDWADDEDDTLDFSAPLALAHNPEPPASPKADNIDAATQENSRRPQLVQRPPPGTSNAWTAGPNPAVNPRAAVRGAAYSGGYYAPQQGLQPVNVVTGYNEEDLKTVTEMKDLMRKKAEARAKQRMKEEEERTRKRKEAAKRKLEELNARLAKRDEERKQKELVEKGVLPKQDSSAPEAQTLSGTPKVQEGVRSTVRRHDNAVLRQETPPTQQIRSRPPPQPRNVGARTMPPKQSQIAHRQQQQPQSANVSAWQQRGTSHPVPRLTDDKQNLTPLQPSPQLPAPRTPASHLQPPQQDRKHNFNSPSSTQPQSREYYQRPVIHPPQPGRGTYRGRGGRAYYQQRHEPSQRYVQGIQRQPYHRRGYQSNQNSAYQGRPAYQQQKQEDGVKSPPHAMDAQSSGTPTSMDWSLPTAKEAIRDLSQAAKVEATAKAVPSETVTRTDTSMRSSTKDRATSKPVSTTRFRPKVVASGDAREGGSEKTVENDKVVKSSLSPSKGENQAPRVLLRRPSDPNQKEDSKSVHGERLARNGSGSSGKQSSSGYGKGKQFGKRFDGRDSGTNKKVIADAVDWDPKVPRKLASFDEISRAFSNKSETPPLKGGAILPPVPVVAPLPPQIPVQHPLLPNGLGSQAVPQSAPMSKSRAGHGRPPRQPVRSDSQDPNDFKELKRQKKARRLRQKEVAAKRRLALAGKAKPENKNETFQGNKQSSNTKAEVASLQSSASAISRTVSRRSPKPASKPIPNRISGPPSKSPASIARKSEPKVTSKPVSKDITFSQVAKSSIDKKTASNPVDTPQTLPKDVPRATVKDGTGGDDTSKQSSREETNYRGQDKQPRNQESRKQTQVAGKGSRRGVESRTNRSTGLERRNSRKSAHQNGGGGKSVWKAKPRMAGSEEKAVVLGSPKSVTDDIRVSPTISVSQKSTAPDIQTSTEARHPTSSEKPTSAEKAREESKIGKKSWHSKGRPDRNGNAGPRRRGGDGRSTGARSSGKYVKSANQASESTPVSSSGEKSEVRSKTLNAKVAGEPTRKVSSVEPAPHQKNTVTTTASEAGEKQNKATLRPQASTNEAADSGSRIENVMNGHRDPSRQSNGSRGLGRGRGRRRGRGRSNSRGRGRGGSRSNGDSSSGQKVWKAVKPKSAVSAATD